MTAVTRCVACDTPIEYTDALAYSVEKCPCCSHHLCEQCREIELQQREDFSLCCRLKDHDCRTRNVRLEHDPHGGAVLIANDFGGITCPPKAVAAGIEFLLESGNPAHDRARPLNASCLAPNSAHVLTYRDWLIAIPVRKVCSWCGKNVADGRDTRSGLISHGCCQDCSDAIERGDFWDLP